jgi:hypothetical protein
MPNKKEKINFKKKPKKRLIKLVLIILTIILILVLLMTLVIQYNFINNFKNLQPKEKIFLIKDECSLILGQIIHQIRDKDECRIRCINECRLENLNIKKSDFVLGNNSCHACNCFCKS